MFCNKCGFQNPGNMKYCGACAASLERVCPGCHAINPANFEYCGHCAHKLSAKSFPGTNSLRADEKAERRQLTVLFCDIVNSSGLSSSLDPEDLRDIMQDYRATCSEVVARYDGHIAQHLGDGILVYFGHPVAHEDDASRATQAGLDIINRIQQFQFTLNDDNPVELSVRIGIHTGLVVIGEIGTDKRALALGDTPNIASRIQDHASANTLIISDATQQLLDDDFEIQSLGTHELKGFTQPVELFHVHSTNSVADSIATSRSLSHNPIVGREQESSLLLEQLNLARKGTGEIVLLSGDPGMGKTRMAQLACEKALLEPCTVLECTGSPYYQNSYFYPVLRLINSILDIHDGLSADNKRHRIEKSVSAYGLAPGIAVPILSELLSIPLSDSYPVAVESTPRQKKHLLMEVLLQIIQSMTRQRFVLFIVEDLQWVDPSTIEFLIFLINQEELKNIFCLLTFRSEFSIPLNQRTNLTRISLNRLTRNQSEKLVNQLCNHKPLPLDIFSEIVSKTEGIPLYIEELTKNVLRTGQLQEKEDHYEMALPMTELGIPTTLKDSLMSRLDGLGIDKELAQLCSILGREFSYEILNAVSQQGETSLRYGLNRLINAEIFFEHGKPPASRYSFRHPLLRDTAYESLLKRTRKKYHQAIATLLMERFKHLIDDTPEIYAHHCAEAGFFEEALEFWIVAGKKAAQQSANLEAIAHFNRGLSILEKLPGNKKSRAWELTLQISLGMAISICKGYASPEVEIAYARARELCDQIANPDATFPVLCGLWEFYIVRAKLDTALVLSNQLLKIAVESGYPNYILEAKRTCATTLFWRGHLTEANRHFSSRKEEYRNRATSVTKNHSPLSAYCQDSRVAMLANSSCTLWLLGKPDQALTRARQALDIARQLSHPFSQAYALQFLATVHQLRGDKEDVSRVSDSQITLSETYQFPFWAATGKMMRAWSTSNQNNMDISLRDYQISLDEYRKSGNRIACSYFYALLADLQEKSGDLEAAHETIDRSLKDIEASKEKYFQAELLRIKGTLFMHDELRTKAAEKFLASALDISQQQGTASLTLRILVSLSQLAENQHMKTYPADVLYRLLQEQVRSITDGKETKDLVLAQRIITRLESKIRNTDF